MSSTLAWRYPDSSGGRFTIPTLIRSLPEAGCPPDAITAAPATISIASTRPTSRRPLLRALDVTRLKIDRIAISHLQLIRNDSTFLGAATTRNLESELKPIPVIPGKDCRKLGFSLCVYVHAMSYFRPGSPICQSFSANSGEKLPRPAELAGV